MIHVENAYDLAKDEGLVRFLIDPEWPKSVIRGIPRREKSAQARSALARIRWCPELAPSAALWRWFHHDAEKLSAFRRRYFAELWRKKRHWLPLLRESKKNDISLLYHGKDLSFTQAEFLKEFLDAQHAAAAMPERAGKGPSGLVGRGISVPVQKYFSEWFARPLRPMPRRSPGPKMVEVPGNRRRTV